MPCWNRHPLDGAGLDHGQPLGSSKVTLHVQQTALAHHLLRFSKATPLRCHPAPCGDARVDKARANRISRSMARDARRWRMSPLPRGSQQRTRTLPPWSGHGFTVQTRRRPPRHISARLARGGPLKPRVAAAHQQPDSRLGRESELGVPLPTARAQGLHRPSQGGTVSEQVLVLGATKVEEQLCAGRGWSSRASRAPRSSAYRGQPDNNEVLDLPRRRVTTPRQSVPDACLRAAVHGS